MSSISPIHSQSKRFTSPSTLKKKPPFISTTKTNEIFGNPPPKPIKTLDAKVDKNNEWNDCNSLTIPSNSALHRNHEEHSSIIRFTEPDMILPSHILHFQKLSLRWLNLSRVFWILTILDCNRHVADRDGFTNFLQVIKWRADGVINESEFTAMYLEWMSKGSSSSSSRPRKLSAAIGLLTFRQILIENECYDEYYLDLYIGMIINETNRNILGQPISYNSNSNNSNSNNSNNDNRSISSTEKYNKYEQKVEICSEQWIVMSEELFFLLDSPGYGFLSYDEVYFLSACLTIGLRGWSDHYEFEDDLSIGMLSATCLQLLIDSDIQIMLSSTHSNNNNKSNSSSTRDWKLFGIHKSVISIPMFKYLLLRKGITEKYLFVLINHIKVCIERLSRVCRPTLYDLSPMHGIAASPYDIITTASHSLENPNSIGSPRLWQYAVIHTVGYTSDESIHALINPQSTYGVQISLQAPPIIVYLLTDAEYYIHGMFRASEGDVSHSLHNSSNNNNNSNNKNNTNSTIPLSMADKLLQQEIQETSYRIWLGFQNWGSNASNHINSMNSTNSTIIDTTGVENSHDSTYHLIHLVLMTYKKFQHILSKALIEMTLKYFHDYSIQNTPYIESDVLSIASMSLLPNIEPILIHMGLVNQPIVMIANSSPNLNYDLAYESHSRNYDNHNPSDEKSKDSVISHLENGQNPVYKKSTDSQLSMNLSNILHEDDRSLELYIEPETGLLQSTTEETKNTISKDMKWSTLFDLRPKTVIEDVNKSNKPTSQGKSIEKMIVNPPIDKDTNLQNSKPLHSQLNQESTLSLSRSKNTSGNSNTIVTTNPKTIATTVFGSQSDSEVTRNRSDRQRRLSEPPSVPTNMISNDSLTSTKELISNMNSDSNKKKSTNSSNKNSKKPETDTNISDEIPIYMKKILDEILSTDDKNHQVKLIEALQVLTSLRSSLSPSKSKPKTSSSSITSSSSHITSSLDMNNNMVSERRKSVSDSSRENGKTSSNSNSNNRRSSPIEKRRPFSMPLTSNENQNRDKYSRDSNEIERKNIQSIEKSSMEVPELSIASVKMPVTSKELSVVPNSNQNHTNQRIKAKPSNPILNKTVNEEGDSNKDSTARYSDISSAPNSISEMFERGQEAGSFAQSLREILRRMSRDDSHIQVKSLEQILRLGHEIVQRESAKTARNQVTTIHSSIENDNRRSPVKVRNKSPSQNVTSKSSRKSPSRNQAVVYNTPENKEGLLRTQDLRDVTIIQTTNKINKGSPNRMESKNNNEFLTPYVSTSPASPSISTTVTAQKMPIVQPKGRKIPGQIPTTERKVVKKK